RRAGRAGSRRCSAAGRAPRIPSPRTVAACPAPCPSSSLARPRRKYQIVKRRQASTLRPLHLAHLTVALLGPRAADREELEPVGPRFERSQDLGGDAHRVPLAQLAHLAVEQDAPRAAEHDVRLLLLAVPVAPRAAVAGPVAPVADAEVAGFQRRAAEAAFD